MVARAGTVAVICPEESTVKMASSPLNFTEETFTKFEPVRMTSDPPTPLVGVKEETTGVPSPDKTVIDAAVDVATALSLSVALAVMLYVSAVGGVQTHE